MNQPNQQQPGNKQGMPNPQRDQKTGQSGQQTQQGNKQGSGGSYNVPGQQNQGGQSSSSDKR